MKKQTLTSLTSSLVQWSPWKFRENVKTRQRCNFVHTPLCPSDCLPQRGIFLKVLGFSSFESIGSVLGQAFGRFSKGLEYQIVWCI